MKANFTATDPGNIKFTMTICMKLKEWEMVKKELTSSFEMSEFRKAIADMINAATKYEYYKSERVE